MFKVQKKSDYKALFIAIAIPLLIGFLGASITEGTREIYSNLVLPSFAPPGFVFPIVWTILYILMGIASYRIYMYGKVTGFNIRLQKLTYFIQLALNFLWTPIFYYFGLRGLAFLEILVLLFFLLITIALFNNRDKLAAKLMLPYLFWVIFAAILNFSVWRLN